MKRSPSIRIVKASTKRILYPVVHPLRKLYWRITRPQTRGVKVLVTHEDKILLVKIGYAHKSWTLPGGGVGRKESSVDAAAREVLEETGMVVVNLEKMGEYFTEIDYKHDTVECFRATALHPEIIVDGFEVVEAGWFFPNELPKERATQVDTILAMQLQ